MWRGLLARYSRPLGRGYERVRKTVRLQNIWHTWVLELVETFGFAPKLTAFLRANVLALSFLLASSIAARLP